jgi:hypothetical protein
MAIMEWFKVNGYNLIYGSLRLDPPIHQLVFIKLLALTSISRVAGVICIADKVPYPMDVLAATIGVSEEELSKAIEYHCLPDQDRLRKNEWGGIEVINWAHYQSKSYLRVKKHREKKRIEEEKNRTEKRQCNGTVTDDNAYVTKFTEFWGLYPRKVGKGKAEESFMKLQPSEALFQKILTAVAEQKLSEQWQRDSGRYIPLPATWLNQKRWGDEMSKGSVKKTKLPTIIGKTCSNSGCRMPAVYKDTSGDYDTYYCRDCMPDKVKEYYE